MRSGNFAPCITINSGKKEKFGLDPVPGYLPAGVETFKSPKRIVDWPNYLNVGPWACASGTFVFTIDLTATVRVYTVTVRLRGRFTIKKHRRLRLRSSATVLLSVICASSFFNSDFSACHVRSPLRK